MRPVSPRWRSRSAPPVYAASGAQRCSVWRRCLSQIETAARATRTAQQQICSCRLNRLPTRRDMIRRFSWAFALYALSVTAQPQAPFNIQQFWSEVRSGNVELESARGTGASSGTSVEGRLTNRTEERIDIAVYFDSPLYLANDGEGQSMVATALYGPEGEYYRDPEGGTAFISVEPGESTAVVFYAYCMDFNRPNPTPSDTFDLRPMPPLSVEVVDRIAQFHRESPRDAATVGQVALWLSRGETLSAIAEVFDFSPSQATQAVELVSADQGALSDFVPYPPAPPRAPSASPEWEAPALRVDTWSLVYSEPDSLGIYMSDDVAQRGDTLVVWSNWVYAVPQTRAGYSYNRSQSNVAVDCSNRRITLIAGYRSYQNEVVESDFFPEGERMWQQLSPGSIGDKAYREICRRGMSR